jgi:hypothetical protein
MLACSSLQPQCAHLLGKKRKRAKGHPSSPGTAQQTRRRHRSPLPHPPQSGNNYIDASALPQLGMSKVSSAICVLPLRDRPWALRTIRFIHFRRRPLLSRELELFCGRQTRIRGMSITRGCAWRETYCPFLLSPAARSGVVWSPDGVGRGAQGQVRLQCRLVPESLQAGTGCPRAGYRFSPGFATGSQVLVLMLFEQEETREVER